MTDKERAAFLALLSSIERSMREIAEAVKRAESITRGEDADHTGQTQGMG